MIYNIKKDCGFITIINTERFTPLPYMEVMDYI